MGTSKAQAQQKVTVNLPTLGTPTIRSVLHRDVENSIIDYASNIFKMNMVGDSIAITDARFINRTVAAVCINDNTKNTGFTKLEISDTLTFTDGTTMSNGDTITLWLE